MKRFDAALLGGSTGLFLGVLETLCRYLPAVRTTELLPVAGPALAATAVYVGLGVAGGLLQRWLGVVLLAALAAASADLDAVGLLAVPAALGLGWLGLRRRAVVLGGVGLALAGALGLPREESPREGAPARPDIVLVVLDTVAARHTSLHGAALDTTPSLAALAREGIDWRQAVATAPWTVPSHASLFTGAPARTAGAHHEHLSLPDELPTTAEELARQGYRTAAFVANPWLGRDSGLTRGFAYQEGDWDLAATREVFAWERARRRFLAPRDKGGARLTARALGWLARGGDRPSFAFLNLMEAHSPYHEVSEPGRFGAASPAAIGARVEEAQSHGADAVDFPREGEVEAARLVYAAAVRAADDRLGELVAGLRAAGRLERTALLVTSDHGEAFGEHGFFGHVIGLHDQTLHVPLVLRGPDAPRGVRRDEPVSLAGVHATLLEIGSGEPQPGSLLPEGPAGIPIVSEQRRPGWLLARFRAYRERDVSALDLRALRVRVGAHALLRETPARGGAPRYAFFDLAADPEGLAPRWPDPRAARLLPLLEAHDRLPVRGEGTPYFDEKARERLEALGYL